MVRDRLRRIGGYVSLSVHRLYVRGTRTATRRTAATVAGVAVAIALLVIATGLAVGLATQTTVYGDDVDYWIVPEGGGDASMLVAVGGPQFGDAHATTERIEAIDGVTYATPVLSTVRFVDGPNGEAPILFVGVVPRENMGRIGGVSPDGLTAPERVNPPNREWHGDVVLSSSAAAQLGVDAESTTIHTDGEPFQVRQIESQRAAADLPIALVQLTDLQGLTGGDEFDTADQYLVSTSEPGVRADLEALHPQSSVNTRADLTATQIVETDSALAIGIGAFIITLVIGTLFVVMTAGLELTSDVATVATLSAIGISTRSQLTLAGMGTLVMTVIGGAIGATVGLASLYAINAIVTQTILSVPVASVHPGLAVYGLLASVVIGLISLPYVRYLIGRIGGDGVMR